MKTACFKFDIVRLLLHYSYVDHETIFAKDGLIARKSGHWAIRKHHFLKNYCGITTTAMRRRFRLIYLDLMAGPGRCVTKESEFDGSPIAALSYDFAHYYFIEQDATLFAALEQRLSAHPKRNQITLWRENWIDVLNSGRLTFSPAELVVAFVDPIGISEVPMTAMLKLASNPRIDLLVTIQHRLGITRNIPQYIKTEDGEAASDAFLDSRCWREWPIGDLSKFTARIIAFFSERIQKEGFRATRHISVPESNPLYQFTLFSRNERGQDFWNKILKYDERGQKDLFWNEEFKD